MSSADAVLQDEVIQEAADMLGGPRVLHRRVRNRLEAHDLLQEGLPGHALTHLVKDVALLRAAGHGSLEKAVGMSLRTYQRRVEAPDARLSPEQSGRAWTFAEILARATALLGDRAEAEAWLDRSAIGLDGRKPIDLLATPAGVALIEDYLTRLEHGVYT